MAHPTLPKFWSLCRVGLMGLIAGYLLSYLTPPKTPLSWSRVERDGALLNAAYDYLQRGDFERAPNHPLLTVTRSPETVQLYVPGKLGITQLTIRRDGTFVSGEWRLPP